MRDLWFARAGDLDRGEPSARQTATEQPIARLEADQTRRRPPRRAVSDLHVARTVIALEERDVLRAQVKKSLERSLAAFERAGVPVAVVSGGSTPTAYEGGSFYGVNEVRPGTYIFNDRNTVAVSAASLGDCALSVLVTVVSTAVSGHAVVDGGSKTFSYDRFQGGDGRGFGIVKEDPAAEVERFSEEHGHMNIARSERRYRVGDRISIIPNHVCTTVNMHDEIYGVRGGQVEEVWRVAARGKVR